MLKSFLTVAKLGSFTKAASELNYAQSTITGQIQQLEQEIGSPLFDRIGKNCYLNDVGEKLLPHANQVVNLEQVMLDIAKVPENIEGSIRIGSVGSLMMCHVLPVISKLIQTHPKVKVHLKTALSTELVEMLKNNIIDIALMIGPEASFKDCESLQVQNETACFFTSSNHPLAQKNNISPSELFAYPFISTEYNTFLQPELFSIASSLGVEIDMSIYSNSAPNIISLVKENLGVSFLSKNVVELENKDNSLKVLDVDIPIYHYYSTLCCHKNKHITKPMHTVIHLLSEKMKGNSTI